MWDRGTYLGRKLILALAGSFRLCDEFEKIAEKALSTPPNTAELMEMKVPPTESLRLYVHQIVLFSALAIIDMIMQ